MNEPWVSIIIPAKNAEKTIERCLISVLSLDYADYEVIIVDDGSGDGTSRVIQKFSDRLKLMSYPQSQGPSRARNEAARQARGEFIAFTDADCVVAKDWLKELLRGFSNANKAAAVGGIQDVPNDDTIFGKRVAALMRKIGFLADYIRQGTHEIVSVNHNPSCNVMHKRDIFMKEGGFREDLWPGEDVEFDYRLRLKGYRLFFNPRAIVYHYRPQDLNNFLKMMFRYGQAQGLLVRRYGIFRKIQILPFITVGLVSIFFISIYWNIKVTIYLAILFFLGSFVFLFFNLPLTFMFVTAFSLWFVGYLKGFLTAK